MFLAHKFWFPQALFYNSCFYWEPNKNYFYSSVEQSWWEYKDQPELPYSLPLIMCRLNTCFGPWAALPKFWSIQNLCCVNNFWIIQTHKIIDQQKHSPSCYKKREVQKKLFPTHGLQKTTKHLETNWRVQKVGGQNSVLPGPFLIYSCSHMNVPKATGVWTLHEKKLPHGIEIPPSAS